MNHDIHRLELINLILTQVFVSIKVAKILNNNLSRN